MNRAGRRKAAEYWPPSVRQTRWLDIMKITQSKRWSRRVRTGYKQHRSAIKIEWMLAGGSSFLLLRFALECEHRRIRFNRKPPPYRLRGITIFGRFPMRAEQRTAAPLRCSPDSVFAHQVSKAARMGSSPGNPASAGEVLRASQVEDAASSLPEKKTSSQHCCRAQLVSFLTRSLSAAAVKDAV